MSALDGGRRFRDLADGAAALADAVAGAGVGEADPLVLAVVPNGVPSGLAVARALGAELRPLVVHRDDGADPRVELPAAVEGRTVVVADDGVETGTAARLAAAALREAGAGRRVLAVPVCPREAEATLALVYDDVIAPVRPLGRRALSWHYETFDTLDPGDARALIDAYERARSGPAVEPGPATGD